MPAILYSIATLVFGYALFKNVKKGSAATRADKVERFALVLIVSGAAVSTVVGLLKATAGA